MVEECQADGYARDGYHFFDILIGRHGMRAAWMGQMLAQLMGNHGERNGITGFSVFDRFGMANGALEAVGLYTTYGLHLVMFATFGLHTPPGSFSSTWYQHR